MELEEDSSPAPRVESTSTERRPVSRSHARRAYDKAMQSLKGKSRNIGRRLPPRPRGAIAVNKEARPEWTVRQMGGKCPPFNSNSNWVHDPSNRRIYVYGGLSPGDHSKTPTSEFYVCDVMTMEWKNNTVRIQCCSCTLLIVRFFFY